MTNTQSPQDVRERVARIIDPLWADLRKALDSAVGEPADLLCAAEKLWNERRAFVLSKADAILSDPAVRGLGQSGGAADSLSSGLAEDVYEISGGLSMESAPRDGSPFLVQHLNYVPPCLCMRRVVFDVEGDSAVCRDGGAWLMVRGVDDEIDGGPSSGQPLWSVASDELNDWRRWRWAPLPATLPHHLNKLNIQEKIAQQPDLSTTPPPPANPEHNTATEEDVEWLKRHLEREKGGGHCGESTSEKIDRQRHNARIDRILSTLSRPTGQAPVSEDRMEIIATAYGQGRADALNEREWMQDKAWMDAVVMLVHYSTFDARRTPEETERQREHWMNYCKQLASTRSVADIAALAQAPVSDGVREAAAALIEAADQNITPGTLWFCVEDRCGRLHGITIADGHVNRLRKALRAALDAQPSDVGEG